MGNNVSAIHQAAMEGDTHKLRVAVQEQPQRINEAEPTQVRAPRGLRDTQRRQSAPWRAGSLQGPGLGACRGPSRAGGVQAPACMPAAACAAGKPLPLPPGPRPTVRCARARRLQGWTPLHIVSAKGYDVLLRELMARGAEPNEPDKEGRTPLHLAAAAGHLQVVNDLLRRRADPALRDKARRVY
jgi:hypothetical protein